MTDGIKLRSMVDERIMEKLVCLWQRASDKNNTRLLQVAEVCPACPGQVGVITVIVSFLLTSSLLRWF